ncbi:MAG: hypothetical protein QOG45_1030 [Chloroflexota bacterium]|nr:hypothetical protein [Chloroflexota bacterium]
MFSRKLTRSIAAGAAAIAVAIGGYSIANSSSTNSASGSANTAPPAQTRQAPSQASQTGHVPQNWRPGSGTIITGPAANKAKAAAVAKYPGGTVNRVLKLSDGSYAVHRIKTPAPHHVFVSRSFKVTGTA